MKRHLVQILKFALALGIVAYLLWDASRHQSFDRLVHERKQWGMLVAGAVAGFLGVLLTIVRWTYLVRALDIPFAMSDGLRLGFLGYLLNFVAPGNVGGDLFKAVFLARERPGRRAEAVASVVADRLVGLYILFVIAAGAMLSFGQFNSSTPEIRIVARSTVTATLVGTVLVGALFVPGLTGGRVTQWLGNLPRVGPLLRRVFDSVRMYRSRPRTLALTLLMTFASHGLFILCVYWLAQGLPGGSPDLGAHVVLVPLALLTGALPVTPNGLGTFELAMEFLYDHSAAAPTIEEGQGTMVALAYRLVTIAIALVGLAFYFANRREVAAVLHEAEEEAEG